MMHLARELVLSLYPKALAEWGPLIARFDELEKCADAAPTPSSMEQAYEDLAAWLEDVQLNDSGETIGNENGHSHRTCEAGSIAHRPHPKINMESVALYMCSCCGNPSAALKKCGGCGQTRYVVRLGCSLGVGSSCSILQVLRWSVPEEALV